MNRRFLAIAMVAGATVPALVAAVFIFGCCVLPFHHEIGEMLPLCTVAAEVFVGETHQGDSAAGHEHPATPAPERETQSAAKWARLVARSARHFDAPFRLTARVDCSPASYRSFITLGAIRCDDDVGLQSLFTAFRI